MFRGCRTHTGSYLHSKDYSFPGINDTDVTSTYCAEDFCNDAQEIKQNRREGAGAVIKVSVASILIAAFVTFML